MIRQLKEKIKTFTGGPKDVPVLVGFISGLYPLLFFYSNNYPAVNSWQQLAFFIAVFLLLPIVLVLAGYAVFSKIPRLAPYKRHMLFTALIFLTSAYMSQALYLTLRKKILLGILIVTCFLAFKLYMHYKRLVLIIAVMALLPLFKVLVHVYEDVRPKPWLEHKDNIMAVKLKHKPNVYMIQPDGYVSRELMENPPYSHKTGFYDWLGSNGFTLYDGFRSNYPASLASNASMFAMKHHYFDDFLFPTIEMPHAREVIVNSSAVDIFNRNGYKTYLVAQDEYFQQNFPKGNYGHYNIDNKDVPFIYKGAKIVRDVYADLEAAIADKAPGPKFIFVEKVLPHHVHFYAEGDRVKAERDEYVANVEQVNTWLKKTIAMISSQDKDALIIILADHGGWVGMYDQNEFNTTADPALVKSTFGNLAAIRWNGLDNAAYDTGLKSSVNVFRVLFACLAENKSYLSHMEDDASYNIRYDGTFSSSVYKLIDDNGTVVRQKHQ